ncbi:hypothetical protein [Pseudonocardia oroxyli]|uniref:Uncharacterized protein n=1 Tax=Pseudonocardia oroxyli TaxID=366584 RepID=A0A1G7G0W2_PSEOR|nr:hypothetical protein [Pseudonocardia oroxyli]SDE81729.1 hypothetical protein SAMN05216377_102171 [Pseudonocardia oroxyli]
MLYLVAFVGAAVIAFLLWRAMNGDRAEIPRGTSAPRASDVPRKPRPTGPDDDADFLRSLDTNLRKPDEGPGETDGPPSDKGDRD